MYKAFSDPQNIEKMVRQIVVFLEEETLRVNLLKWKGDVSPNNHGHWVKYVSTKSKEPREVYLYWDKKAEDMFLEEMAELYLNKKGYFEELNEYFLNSYKDLKKLTDKLFKKGPDFYKKQSNQKLIKLFKKFNEVNKYALAAYYVVYDSVNLLPRIVKKEIKEALPDFGESEAEDMVQALSTIGIDTVLRSERLEFLKKLKLIQKIYAKQGEWKDKKIQSLIFRHWYDFGACMYEHATNENYKLSDYQNKFRKNIRLNADSEIEKIKSDKRDETKMVNDVLKKLKKHLELKKHIKWTRKMMGYRNREAEYYDVYFAHTLDFFYEIAVRLNIKKDDIWLLATEEIIDGLLSKSSTKEIVKKRKKKGFTIKQVGRQIKVWTGVRPEDWHEEKIKKSAKLKGNIAYQGKAKGVARIIFNPQKEGAKLKKNEILITSMTTPDFVPLMKRAKAVVTDEGGLLCHAAIVSRELKKPCIIGTKIATQVLKDGDLVEVDAERGIVTIIQKASKK